MQDRNSQNRKPETGETIFTPTYNALTTEYFSQLLKEKQKEENDMKRNESSLLEDVFFFFIRKYDDPNAPRRDSREEEKFEDLLFFDSTDELDSSMQERLVGQVQALLMETNKYEPRNERVIVINFSNARLGLGYINNEIVFCVGFNPIIPVKLIRDQMCIIVDGIFSYYGPNVKELTSINCSEFVKDLGLFLVPSVRFLKERFLSLFHPIIMLPLPYKYNRIFIKGNNFLNQFYEDKDEGFLNGAVVFDGQILCHSMIENILEWCLYRSNNMHHIREKLSPFETFLTSINNNNNNNDGEEGEGENEEGHLVDEVERKLENERRKKMKEDEIKNNRKIADENHPKMKFLHFFEDYVSKDCFLGSSFKRNFYFRNSFHDLFPPEIQIDVFFPEEKEEEEKEEEERNNNNNNNSRNRNRKKMNQKKKTKKKRKKRKKHPLRFDFSFLYVEDGEVEAIRSDILRNCFPFNEDFGEDEVSEEEEEEEEGKKEEKEEKNKEFLKEEIKKLFDEYNFPNCLKTKPKEGEFLFCVILKYGAFSLIRLYEFNKIHSSFLKYIKQEEEEGEGEGGKEIKEESQQQQEQFEVNGWFREMKNLKKEIEQMLTLERDFKYVQQNELKIRSNLLSASRLKLDGDKQKNSEDKDYSREGKRRDTSMNVLFPPDLVRNEREVENSGSSSSSHKRTKSLGIRSEFQYYFMEKRKTKEYTLVYDGVSKSLEGDFLVDRKSTFLPNFCSIHNHFQNEGVNKVILKSENEIYYAKKLFDHEVFYCKKRKKENSEDLRLDDIEEKVKRKVRNHFKLNLL